MKNFLATLVRGCAYLVLLAFLPHVWAQSVIQRENAKTAGVTALWQIPDASYASAQEIEGYAAATSVNRGGSIKLFVQAKASDPTYTINIYRIGWYGGVGGRQVAGPITRNRTVQPACQTTNAAVRLVECNWIDPYVLTIPNSGDPTDWASGVYLAKLTGSSTGKQSYIIFVVRDDARSASVMFQTSVTTYAAYNRWGGYDFYGPVAAKLSFDRPYSNPERYLNGKGTGDFLSWEINMLRFVEREGYDSKYSTNIDTHTNPSRLLSNRLFLSVGHDEYYTKEMYDALVAARNGGVNLGFFTSNAIYWQVRLEPSSLTGEPNRTVVGYKYDTDPMQFSATPHLSTYLWRETVRAPINRPEASLMGVMYDFNSLDVDMVIADCSSWICAGTNVPRGHIVSGMVGYEVDRIAPSSPPNLTILTSSPYQVCPNGACETRYGNSTFYTAASGAGVFAAGTIQWSWGLDSFTPGPRITQDGHVDRSSPVIQQITRNLMNRFTSVGGNNPPVITSTAVTSAAPGAAYSYPVTASDLNSDALAFSLTQAPSGMLISPNGLITWTPTAAQLGSQAVTVRVSDPGGLAATQSFTINVSTSTATWTRCAGEGGTCSFAGARTVRYGANGTYVTRTVTGSIVCSNAAFGGDPLPNVPKQCKLQGSGTGPTTTANPVFSLAAGTYPTAQTLTLSTPTAGATIRYTTNGTTPTAASSVYSAPLAINTTTTVMALATAAGLSNSGVVSATYTIGTASAGWIRCATEGGTCSVSGTRSVRFGQNGTYATRTVTGSIVCSNVAFGGDPLPNVAKVCDYQDSGTAPTGTANPVFSLAAGTYATAQTVSLSTPTAGATIYYTTNGSTPTTGSTVYSAPLAINATTTVMALATASGLSNSGVVSATYTITPASTGTWVRCANEIDNGICTFSGTRTVRFGLNGSYLTRTATGSIACTRDAFGGDPLPNVWKVCEYQNTTSTATVTANPVFSLAAGSYVGAQSVTLSTPTAGASIFYTTNGTIPTTASTRYSAAIGIGATTTVNALATASGLSNSPVVSATYTITAPGGAGWTRCASEGGTCSFSGTRTVRFGQNGTYATRTATGSIVCSNAAFGGDPLPNVAKQCEYQ